MVLIKIVKVRSQDIYGWWVWMFPVCTTKEFTEQVTSVTAELRVPVSWTYPIPRSILILPVLPPLKCLSVNGFRVCKHR